MGRKHDIIVVGASMGGIEAISSLLAKLPPGLAASVFVVQHVGEYGSGLFDQILQRVTKMPVAYAEDAKHFRPAHVYVARPGLHMLIEEGVVRTTRGPKENRTRPAIDPLFRSAAVNHGPHAVGVVLTGMLNDGTAGLRAIERCGGKTVVQDPLQAQFPEMPANAMRHVHVDHCLALLAIAELLTELSKIDAPPAVPIPADLLLEDQIAKDEMGEISQTQQLGEPVPLSCPECGGTLVMLRDGALTRFRCHTGHALTAEALFSDQSHSVERSLWVALRALHEQAALAGGLAKEAKAAGAAKVAASYEAKEAEASYHADRIHQVLMGLRPLPDGGSPPAGERSRKNRVANRHSPG